MKHFFADIWGDLREKRLWPVAALLVVALVALPVVLSEKRKDPPPVPASANAKPEQLPTVTVSDDTVFSSNLQAFKAKDPFKPGKQQIKDLSRTSTRAVGGLLSSAGASAGGGSLGGGASSASAGGGSGSSGGSSGGGSGGGGGAKTPAPTKTKSTAYRYVADVTFGRAGSERSYRGLQRLEMLPSTDTPLLVFLGATRSGGDAVFLVDSNLRQAGEGSCADKACSVLSIGPGSEHRFKDEANREYVLVIDRIRRVKVGGSASTSNRKAGASSPRPASGVAGW